MAIAYRGATTPAVHGSQASPLSGISEPAGAASGDYIIGLWIVDAVQSAAAAPGTWNTLASGLATGGFRFVLARIIRGGSAPSFAFTHTGGGTPYCEFFCLYFSGVDGTTPEDVTIVTSGPTNAAQINPPAVTPTNANCMIVAGGGNWGGSNPSWTAPANYTLRSDNTGGNDGALITRLLSGGGGASEDPGNITGQATSNPFWAFTLALRPAGAGGTDATVTAVPADATGAFPIPTVTATGDATVTAPPADATGASPAPTLSAGSTVTTPPADATGDFPDDMPVSVTVSTGPSSGTGAFPAPTVTTGQTVIAPPADATGTSPAPTLSAGSTVTTPAAAATGDFPAPTSAGPPPEAPPDTHPVTGGVYDQTPTGGTVTTPNRGGTPAEQILGGTPTTPNGGGTVQARIRGGQVTAPSRGGTHDETATGGQVL